MNILSYNCEGANRNRNCIKHILETTAPDILCLQETWLLDSAIHVLQDIDAGYNVFGKCGVDIRKGIIPGRPQGGLAIFYKKCMDKFVKIVKCKSRRLFALEFINEGYKNILLANVYMPCDSREWHVNHEFDEVIDELDLLIASRPDSHIILCGD